MSILAGRQEEVVRQEGDACGCWPLPRCTCNLLLTSNAPQNAAFFRLLSRPSASATAMTTTCSLLGIKKDRIYIYIWKESNF
jgi:hypothetical protein